MLRLSLLALLAPNTLGDHANHATHTLGSQTLHATYTPGDQAHHTSQAVEPYSPVLAQEAAYPHRQDYGQEYAQVASPPSPHATVMPRQAPMELSPTTPPQPRHMATTTTTPR